MLRMSTATPLSLLTDLQRFNFNPHALTIVTVIHTELATSWVADLLGHWAQESHYCLVPIWYVVQCDSDIQGQVDQLCPQDLF
jgi:hypothetical protein